MRHGVVSTKVSDARDHRAACVLRSRAVTGLLAALLVSACTSGDAETESLGLVPVIELSEPALEIGTLDGPEEYTFAAIESVIRLPGGAIAVSDAGTTRITILQADGTFARSWGRRGDGPGEFRNLSSIYPLGNDSLMAADRFTGRLSTFDLNGAAGRTLDGPELSGDSVFALDSWLHGRFWVRNALRPHVRDRARSALDRLPQPLHHPGYRVVVAGAGGDLWIAEPASSDAARVWTRVGAGGRPEAMVSVPARFRPTHFLDDEVLGVWIGEADVHFVRVYALAESASASEPLPTWLIAGVDETAHPLDEAPDHDALLAAIRGEIRQMASAQEIHYSQHMTYTTAIDSLAGFDPPEGVTIDFEHADERGWTGVFAHEGVDQICALGYGFAVPAGWTPGRVMCAPERRAPGAGS